MMNITPQSHRQDKDSKVEWKHAAANVENK